MQPSPTIWNGIGLANGITTHGPGSDGTMTATSERLTIESGVGSFSFRPEDIVLITRAGTLPWFGAGILVRHRVEGYPYEIGFCPRGTSSKEVLKVLATYGYQVG